MTSDYEILVLREIEKGKRDPKEIAKELGIPEAVVRVAMERAEGKSLSRKRIVFTRESFKLLIDVLILYVVINVMLQVVAWF